MSSEAKRSRDISALADSDGICGRMEEALLGCAAEMSPRRRQAASGRHDKGARLVCSCRREAAVGVVGLRAAFSTS